MDASIVAGAGGVDRNRLRARWRIDLGGSAPGGQRSNGRGRLGRSHARAHGTASDRHELLRAAHGEALVQWSHSAGTPRRRSYKEGFPLIGARVDVIDNTPVPTLVYGRRLHIISLSAISDEGRRSGPAARRSTNGYNVVSWRENGVSYWAVSDLGVGELETFAQLLRKAPTG